METNRPNAAAALEPYLRTDAHREIFKRLRSGFFKHVFKDYTAFFKLLDEQEEILVENLDVPSDAIEDLLNLELTEPQIAFLVQSLVLLWETNDIGNEHKNWDSLKRELKLEAEELENRTIFYSIDRKTAEPLSFEAIEAQLPALPSTMARVDFLRNTLLDWKSKALDTQLAKGLAFDDSFFNQCKHRYEEVLYGEEATVPAQGPDTENESSQLAVANRAATLMLELSNERIDGRLNLRQKALALTLLMFDRLDIPEGTQKSAVTEFVHLITENNPQNIKVALGRLTVHKEDSRKSLNKLISELQDVQMLFEKVGLSEKAGVITSEIDFILSSNEKD